MRFFITARHRAAAGPRPEAFILAGVLASIALSALCVWIGCTAAAELIGDVGGRLLQ